MANQAKLINTASYSITFLTIKWMVYTLQFQLLHIANKTSFLPLNLPHHTEYKTYKASISYRSKHRRIIREWTYIKCSLYIQFVKSQILGSAYHCVWLDNGKSRTLFHTSHTCSLQNYHRLNSSAVEMKCLVDPHQPSNMLGHEEAGILDLPVTVPE